MRGDVSVDALEVLVIECPGERLDGGIMLALTSAVDSGALRIIDVTFVHKDPPCLSLVRPVEGLN